jgi:hypothetical protein
MQDLSVLQQHNIRIAVDFFDKDERLRLLRYPTSAQIADIVSKGADINVAQFLTYYLFHKKRPGMEGFRNSTQLGTKIGRALAELDGWVHFRDGSLVSDPNAIPQDLAITEHIGEAAALSVVGQIHDIHDADWDKIPQYPGRSGFKTFDYEHTIISASDGKLVIQVEAKGTVVENTSDISKNVKLHKANIDDKKAQIRTLEHAGTYRHPANVRYGVICALGRTGPLRCWLTDPPGEDVSYARRYRLLARLQFMFDWISFLSGGSQLAASLATRLRALNALVDPFVLSEVPLLRGNGKPFDLAEFSLFHQVPGFYAHLCRVTDGPAVGTIVQLPDNRLFFLGVQRELFEMAAAQTFDAIVNYRSYGGSIHKTVNCVVPRGRAKTMGIIDLDDRPYSASAYITFQASGILHYSHGDAVFGVITPKQARG